MVIRRGWADSIAVKSDGDSLILTGVRLSRPEVDLFDQGYAKVKNDKDSRPLYLWLSEVSNADEVAVAAACYGAFYGELMEHSFPPFPHKEPSVISQELS